MFLRGMDGVVRFAGQLKTYRFTTSSREASLGMTGPKTSSPSVPDATNLSTGVAGGNLSQPYRKLSARANYQESWVLFGAPTKTF